MQVQEQDKKPLHLACYAALTCVFNKLLLQQKNFSTRCTGGHARRCALCAAVGSESAAGLHVCTTSASSGVLIQVHSMNVGNTLWQARHIKGLHQLCMPTRSRHSMTCEASRGLQNACAIREVSCWCCQIL